MVPEGAALKKLDLAAAACKVSVAGCKGTWNNEQQAVWDYQTFLCWCPEEDYFARQLVTLHYFGRRQGARD